MLNFPDMPPNIATLPTDERGYPVPWFVHWNKDGTPNFPIIGTDKLLRAITEHRCWVCGIKLGKFMTFVIGPMCAINKVTSEPPNHKECARFAAKYCPFLANPKMKYAAKIKDAPPDAQPPAGHFIDRNPGVTCLWTTMGFKRLRLDSGLLFRIDSPVHVEWWSQGRKATLAEVEHSINTGVPILHKIAEEEGPEAVKDLNFEYLRTMELVGQTI